MMETLRPNDFLDWELRARRDPSLTPLIEMLLDQQAEIAALREEVDACREDLFERDMVAEDLGCLDGGDGGLYIPKPLRRERRTIKV